MRTNLFIAGRRTTRHDINEYLNRARLLEFGVLYMEAQKERDSMLSINSGKQDNNSAISEAELLVALLNFMDIWKAQYQEDLVMINPRGDGNCFMEAALEGMDYDTTSAEG